jgi:heterodisulfide reductase subunit C2
MGDTAARIIVDDLDTGFCDEVASTPGGENIRKCYACGTCAAGCPVTDIDQEYSSRRIIRQVLLGMREEVLSSPVIWYCVLCYRCYARCPQEVNFTDVMRALRYLAIKSGYISPRILEKAEDVDHLAQKSRHDIIADTFAGRKQIMEEVKSLLAETEKREGGGE